MAHQVMSPEEAKTFATFSGMNATTVALSLDCDCEPYKDVFTYKRWLAQGFQVQRGEKSIKIPVMMSSVKEVDGVEISKRFMGTGALFCRCQVKAIS